MTETVYAKSVSCYMYYAYLEGCISCYIDQGLRDINLFHIFFKCCPPTKPIIFHSSHMYGYGYQTTYHTGFCGGHNDLRPNHPSYQVHASYKLSGSEKKIMLKTWTLEHKTFLLMLLAILLHVSWYTLQWRHRSTSTSKNHQQLDYLFNSLFRPATKETFLLWCNCYACLEFSQPKLNICVRCDIWRSLSPYTLINQILCAYFIKKCITEPSGEESTGGW